MINASRPTATWRARRSFPGAMLAIGLSLALPTMAQAQQAGRDEVNRTLGGWARSINITNLTPGKPADTARDRSAVWRLEWTDARGTAGSTTAYRDIVIGELPEFGEAEGLAASGKWQEALPKYQVVLRTAQSKRKGFLLSRAHYQTLQAHIKLGQPLEALQRALDYRTARKADFDLINETEKLIDALPRPAKSISATAWTNYERVLEAAFKQDRAVWRRYVVATFDAVGKPYPSWLEVDSSDKFLRALRDARAKNEWPKVLQLTSDEAALSGLTEMQLGEAVLLKAEAHLSLKQYDDAVIYGMWSAANSLPHRRQGYMLAARASELADRKADAKVLYEQVLASRGRAAQNDSLVVEAQNAINRLGGAPAGGAKPAGGQNAPGGQNGRQGR